MRVVVAGGSATNRYGSSVRGRSLSVLAVWRPGAVWRPRVIVDRVDLGDGLTLQITGSCSARLLRQLRLVATSADREVVSAPESVGVADGLVAFHAIADLRESLDEPQRTVAARFVARRIGCRVTWAPGAMASRNAKVMRPVAPDTAQRVRARVQRDASRTQVIVRTKALSSRPALTAISLGASCNIAIDGASAGATPMWRYRDDAVAATRTATGWSWPQLADLAVDGGRWRLIVRDADGKARSVRLPLSDLRRPHASRVFPHADVVMAGVTHRLTATTDRRGRIVLRSRVRTRSGAHSERDRTSS